MRGLFAERVQLGLSGLIFYKVLLLCRQAFAEVVGGGRLVAVEQAFHAGVEPHARRRATALT